MDAREPLVISISRRSKEPRPYEPVWNLTISNPSLKLYLQRHLLAERFVYGGNDHRGFLTAGVKTYLMTPMSPLINSPTFLLHFYILCSHQGSALVTRVSSTFENVLELTQALRGEKIEIEYCFPKLFSLKCWVNAGSCTSNRPWCTESSGFQISTEV